MCFKSNTCSLGRTNLKLLNGYVYKVMLDQISLHRIEFRSDETFFRLDGSAATRLLGEGRDTLI